MGETITATELLASKSLEEKFTLYSAPLYKATLAAFFLFFLFQVFFIAQYTQPNGPDELRHLYISKIYQENPYIIPFNDKPEYARILFETPATPYLYHLTMGWLLHCNVFKVDDLSYLRGINAALSAIFFIYLVLLLRQLHEDRYGILISLAFCTNVFMLVYLWGSVSYDNFTNLFAIASFYYFVRFMKKWEISSLVLLVIFMGAGSLTKFTFLPLALFFGIIIGWRLCTSNLLGRMVSALKKARTTPGKLLLLPIALTIVVLNLFHYGGNIVKYNAVMPSVEDVRGEGMARDPISKRNKRILTDPSKPLQMSAPLFTLQWIWVTNKRIFGVCSHKTIYLGEDRLWLINGLLLLAGLFFLYNCKDLLTNTTDLLLVLCCSSYWMLVFLNNYFSYTEHHVFGVALQGRYLFPVYFVLAGLIIKYIVRKVRTRMKFLLFILVFTVFFSNGLQYFLRHANSSWYI